MAEETREQQQFEDVWRDARHAAVVKAHSMLDRIVPLERSTVYTRDDYRALRECVDVLVNLAPHGALESPFLLHADEGEGDA